MSFIDELEQKCELLARWPGIGTARPELGDGVRVLPHGRYLIFHRHVGVTLRVERVLHGARDIVADDLDPYDAPRDVPLPAPPARRPVTPGGKRRTPVSRASAKGKRRSGKK